jgi:glycosyltransferase involved in cell wall biosynthesis
MKYDFTIVTPSFNQAKYIKKTIESVISQAGDFSIQYIVADGGSTDDSVSIIKNYSELINSSKYKPNCKKIDFIWWSKKDKGQSDAINKGFKMAKGKYVAWINSDDFYLPNAFKLAKDSLDKNKEIGLICGNFYEVNEKNKRLNHIKIEKKFDLNKLINNGNYIGQPSSFFRLDKLKEVGYLNEKYHYAMDYDLWIKLGKVSSVKMLDEDIAGFRLHPDSKTVSLYSKFWLEDWKISMSHGGKIFSEIFLRHPLIKARREKLNALYSKHPVAKSRISKISRAIKMILKFQISLAFSKLLKNIKNKTKNSKVFKKSSTSVNRIIENINARLKLTISLDRIIPANPKVAIALLIQDRPEYLKYSLESILQTNTDGLNLTILLHDDGSEDKETIKLVENAKSKKIKILKYRRNKPSGSWGGAFNSAMTILLKSGEFDIVGSADSDAYFHPDWLKSTLRVARYAKKHYKKSILGPFSSFNSSDQDFHKIIDVGKTPYGKYLVKERMGALNYLYCYKDFIKLGKFEENRDDETLMTEKFRKLRVRNFCTEKSYIEHIGIDSILNKYRPVPVANAVYAINLIERGWTISPKVVKKKIALEVIKKINKSKT